MRSTATASAFHCEHRRANFSVGSGVIKEHCRGVAQVERSGVQIAERAQPCFLRCRLRTREHRRGNSVEEIDHVITGGGFERANEGNQCRRAAIIGQTRDRLRLGGGCEAGKCCRLARRYPIQLRQARGERADILEPGYRATDFGTTLQGRSVAQTIERTLALILRNDDEIVEAGPLLGSQPLDEATIQVFVDARPYAGDRAFEQRQARQQHLAGQQP